MAEKRLIDSRELSRVLKEYFHALIESGKDLVEITEFNAELQKIIGMMPTEEGIEWYAAEKGLPAVSDEYLVMIFGAKEPTVLCYDAEDRVFFEERIDLEGDVTYRVTHWAEIPRGITCEAFLNIIENAPVENSVNEDALRAVANGEVDAK